MPEKTSSRVGEGRHVRQLCGYDFKLGTWGGLAVKMALHEALKEGWERAGRHREKSIQADGAAGAKPPGREGARRLKEH